MAEGKGQKTEVKRLGSEETGKLKRGILSIVIIHAPPALRYPP